MQPLSPKASHDELTPEEARAWIHGKGWSMQDNDLSILWTVFGRRGRQRICIIDESRARAWRKACDQVRLMGMGMMD